MDTLNLARALPAELLLTIIADGADYNPARLMTFALVCRQWHNLIIGEASLWSHLSSYFSVTARQWCLQLSRASTAPLHVTIEDANAYAARFAPERLTPVIFQDAYIPHITVLNVVIRTTALKSELQFSYWKALADGRHWPTLKSLRVAECYFTNVDDDTPMFQVNICAPQLEEISLYRASAHSWKSLGLGPRTRVVEWDTARQPAAVAIADFYNILPQMENLEGLGISSNSKDITLRALIHAGLAWEKLVWIKLGLVDADFADIEAVLWSSPHLTQFHLIVENKVVDIPAEYHHSRQRPSHNSLEVFHIEHNVDLAFDAPAIETSFVELLTAVFDLSYLRELDLVQCRVPRGSPLPSRCMSLVDLNLSIAAFDPTFMADLQQCKNLERILMNIMWDYDSTSQVGSASAWPLLGHFTPLPRLRSLELFTSGASIEIRDTFAAEYVSNAAAQLACNAREEVDLRARAFTSTAEILLMLPQTPLRRVHISVTTGTPRAEQAMLDILVQGMWADIEAKGSTPESWQDQTIRRFLVYPTALSAVFDAAKLWLEDGSDMEMISLHEGVADDFPEVVRGASEQFGGSKFKVCDSGRFCSHMCREGKPMILKARL